MKTKLLRITLENHKRLKNIKAIYLKHHPERANDFISVNELISSMMLLYESSP
jgi:hypothetical protein